MLINCPKCGFSQPKDRYCANCGVDMENYKPAQPSLASRILGNPILHVAGIFVLVLGAVVFIKQQKKVEYRQRAEYLQGGPVVVNRGANGETTPTQTPAADSSTMVAENVPAPPPAETPQTFAAASAVPGSTRELRMENMGGTMAPNEPPRSQGIKVSALYVEMDIAPLRALVADSQATGQFAQFGDASWGVVPDIAQKIARLSGSTIHDRAEAEVNPRTMSTTWHVGTTENAPVEYGLTTFVSVADVGRNTLRGEVEVRRSFPETVGKPQPVTRSYPANFELPPGAGFMMIGIIPHRIWMEPIEALRPDSLFKIYNSKKFEGSQSEFVMFLQFDTPSNQDDSP